MEATEMDTECKIADAVIRQAALASECDAIESRILKRKGKRSTKTETKKLMQLWDRHNAAGKEVSDLKEHRDRLKESRRVINEELQDLMKGIFLPDSSIAAEQNRSKQNAVQLMNPPNPEESYHSQQRDSGVHMGLEEEPPSIPGTSEHEQLGRRSDRHHDSNTLEVAPQEGNDAILSRGSDCGETTSTCDGSIVGADLIRGGLSPKSSLYIAQSTTSHNGRQEFLRYHNGRLDTNPISDEVDHEYARQNLVMGTQSNAPGQKGANMDPNQETCNYNPQGDGTRSEANGSVAEERLDVRRWNDHVQGAQHNLVVHQATYSDQLREFKEEHLNSGDDTSTVFGPIYLQRGRDLTRKVIEAEEALESAKTAAKNAAVSNASDQESNFVSVPKEGYNDSYKQECVQTCKRKRIMAWLDDEREIGAPSESEGCPELREVEPWDSLSCVAEVPRFKKKIRLMSWQRLIRDQKDQATSKKRRNSY
jgi:hypothetical protein